MHAPRGSARMQQHAHAFACMASHHRAGQPSPTDIRHLMIFSHALKGMYSRSTSASSYDRPRMTSNTRRICVYTRCSRQPLQLARTPRTVREVPGAEIPPGHTQRAAATACLERRATLEGQLCHASLHDSRLRGADNSVTCCSAHHGCCPADAGSLHAQRISEAMLVESGHNSVCDWPPSRLPQNPPGPPLLLTMRTTGLTQGLKATMVRPAGTADRAARPWQVRARRAMVVVAGTTRQWQSTGFRRDRAMQSAADKFNLLTVRKRALVGGREQAGAVTEHNTGLFVGALRGICVPQPTLPRRKECHPVPRHTSGILTPGGATVTATSPLCCPFRQLFPATPLLQFCFVEPEVHTNQSEGSAQLGGQAPEWLRRAWATRCPWSSFVLATGTTTTRRRSSSSSLWLRAAPPLYIKTQPAKLRGHSQGRPKRGTMKRSMRMRMRWTLTKTTWRRSGRTWLKVRAFAVVAMQPPLRPQAHFLVLLVGAPAWLNDACCCRSFRHRLQARDYELQWHGVPTKRGRRRRSPQLAAPQQQHAGAVVMADRCCPSAVLGGICAAAAPLSMRTARLPPHLATCAYELAACMCRTLPIRRSWTAT